eukprot:287599-Rhodomonas_salina.1
MAGLNLPSCRRISQSPLQPEIWLRLTPFPAIRQELHHALTHLMVAQGAGNYLATVGPNRQVQICDRYGQVVDDVSLTAGGQVFPLRGQFSTAENLSRAHQHLCTGCLPNAGLVSLRSDQQRASHFSAVLALDWDADGETLAVLQQNNSALILWDAVQKKTSMLETNTKDLSWMKWSKTGAVHVRARCPVPGAHADFPCTRRRVGGGVRVRSAVCLRACYAMRGTD